MKNSNVIGYLISCVVFVGFFFGCAKNFEPHTISYSDLKEIAYEGAKSFLEEYQADDKKILVISDFSNLTDQDIDVELLSRVLAREIRKNKNINLTNTISGNAIKVDEMVYDARELRNDKEFDLKTLTKEGKLIAPDFSLSGKITQKATPIGKDLAKIDYVFLLTLTDIRTGLVIWDKDIIISKMVQPSEVVVLKPQEMQVQTKEENNNKSMIQPKIPTQQEKKFKKDTFFLGMDGGVSFNRNSDVDIEDRFPYAFRVRGGYIHRWKPDLSLSLQVIYEALKMQERISKRFNHRGRDDDGDDGDYRDKIHHQFGLGAMLQYKVLYLGGGVLYDFNKAVLPSQNIHPYLESGIVVMKEKVGINLGVRYAFSINNPSYDKFGLGAFLGLIFIF
ncbi:MULTISPECIES: hypothetical protein [unclassified Helicobacter]|uniref:hypothetical protein n=1 Tax=unclassified Helicobacter TaxID=2593540 RepID=UPI001315AAAB|nr:MULTISPECIES: hypothetical protein [unclassified Helicobacter]